jgi:hypothetical protein
MTLPKILAGVAQLKLVGRLGQTNDAKVAVDCVLPGSRCSRRAMHVRRLLAPALALNRELILEAKTTQGTGPCSSTSHEVDAHLASRNCWTSAPVIAEALAPNRATT